MDEEHFEHVFLSVMGTLALGLRYMMDARPLTDDEDPDGDEKPEEVKQEKVVAIGGKKQ